MKFENAIDESITMKLSSNPKVVKLWLRLAKIENFNIEDIGLYMNFQAFYQSFMKKNNNRSPKIEDALKFARHN